MKKALPSIIFLLLVFCLQTNAETCLVERTEDSYITCNGNAYITYDDGTIYMGGWDLERQVPHGVGQINATNGTVYYGDIVYAVKTGQGELRYVNGDVYKGGWLNDEMNGEGIVTIQNKDYKVFHENGKKISFELLSDVIDREKELAIEEQQKLEEEKMNLAASRCLTFGFKIEDEAYPQCMMTMMIEEEQRAQEKLANEIKLAEMELRIAELESENLRAQNEKEKIRKAKSELQIKKEQEAWINLVLAESKAKEKQRNTNFWLNLAASDPVQPGESLISTMAEVFSTGKPSRKQSNTVNHSQSRCSWVNNYWICNTYP